MSSTSNVYAARWRELVSITLCLGLILRVRCSTQACLSLPDRTTNAMFTEEDKIHLIHEHRTTLLNRMFDELCGKAPWRSAEQVGGDIIATARVIQKALSNCDEIQHPPRGLFLLALQQIVDSFIAGLLTDEAFEWLAERQKLSQAGPECTDPRDGPHRAPAKCIYRL